MDQSAVSGQGASLLARRPEIVPICATVLAWAALLADSPAVDWSSVGGPRPTGGHAAHGGVLTPAGVAMVTAMTIAMMGPLAIPGARAVATRWSTRAGGALAWFFLAFIAAWAVIAVILATVAETLGGVLGSAATAAGVLALLCAMIEFDPRRRDALPACDRPFGLRSPSAAADCARFGVSSAGGGFRLCALPMLAMLALPGSLPFMALLTVLVVVDRRTVGRHRGVIAALYAAIGFGLLGVELLT